MQAIKVQIYFSEWEKVSDFISEINIDEEMAAYAIDNRTMVIATVGECSMAYAKAQLKTWFSWKSHSTLTLLATQNYPFLLKYDCPLWLK